MSLPRKGALLRRRTDGYVFRVERVSRAAGGAFLQCVDATLVYGWFWADDLTRDFERVRMEKEARS